MINTTSLKVDKDNNLLYSTSGFLIVEDDEALAQDVRNRLRLYKGEYFLNPNIGVCFHKDLDKVELDTLVFSIKKELRNDSRIKSYNILTRNEGGLLHLDIEIITKEGKKINV